MPYSKESRDITKNKKNTILFLFLVVILTTFFIGDREGLSIVVTGISIVIWIPVFLKFKWRLNRSEKKYVFVSFSFLLLMFFYNLIGYSTFNLISITRNISWILAGLISIYVMKIFSVKERSFLFVIFLLLIILMLVTLVEKGRSYEMDEAFATANAWVSSMLMILSGICLIAANQVKSLFSRFIFVSIILLSVYINFFILQRGINAVLSLFLFVLILSLNIKNIFLVKLIFVTTIIFALILFMTDIYIDFFDWMANVIPSERLSIRIKAISLSIQYIDVDAGGGTLKARSELMEISWNTFTSGMQNFIFGAGGHKENNLIIGNHSFILDTLASYGIIGGIVFYIYFKKQIQFIMSYVNKKDNPVMYSQCIVVICIYIFRNYFGAMANANINFVMLLFFPLTIEMIKRYNTKYIKKVNK